MSEVEQRSDEWFNQRLGIPTASSYNQLITSRGEPSKQARTYIDKLIAQRLTGHREESFSTVHTERGIELEPKAIAWFEFETDLEVTETGFHRHPTIETGCSPDGLVGDDALLEIKAPASHTHVKYLRGGKVPSEYYAQVQGQLWVMGKDHGFFLSYHPEMPKLLLRVERDESFIQALEEQVIKACETINEETKKLKGNNL